jgi:hypothetical protein
MSTTTDLKEIRVQQQVNPIELWKAIHGGCWPGPPIDVKLSDATRELLASLALHNLSHSFADERVAAKVRDIAASNLNRAIPALQAAVGG